MKRIIKSLLDIDRYKLTMAQFVFFFYKNAEVEYAFTNRTKNEKAQKILVQLIPAIIREINKVKDLRLSFSEMMHLKNEKIFKDEFLEFLSTMQLPPVDVHEENGALAIKIKGPWATAMFWETIILSIIAELYAYATAAHKYFPDKIIEQIIDSEQFRYFDDEFIKTITAPYYKEAMKRLDIKIEDFLRHPTISFFEFGTRRRYSAKLQEMILKRLSEAFHKPQFLGQSQFLGTSNEHLAMKLGLKAGGTMAHEMFMVIAGLNNDSDDKIINSQYDFLREWNAFYGYDLSVALTDTFGSDYFFKNCPSDIAQMYSFREDSAINLFAYTEAVLDLYRKHNVNHNEKVIIHSNGLDKNKIIGMDSYSQGKIKKAYGYGTDCSCDVGNDFEHLSMVIKAVKANGIDLVKLSDNLAKSIGEEKQKERYKRIFGYTNVETEVQVY